MTSTIVITPDIGVLLETLYYDRLMLPSQESQPHCTTKNVLIFTLIYHEQDKYDYNID